MNHARRIERVKLSLESERIDALLVTNLTNVAYLTGFTGTNGQVLVTKDSARFFTDGRYAARAASMVKEADIAIYSKGLSDLLPDALSAAGVGRLGVESTTMTLKARDDLAKKLPDVELVAVADVIEEGRRTKEPAEIEKLRRAIAIGDEVFEAITQRLVPGMSERDVALELEVELRKRGAEAVSFDPIVGSGPLSAHIHHTAGDRTFEKGDLILLDFGCKFEGYCSDMTRTVVLGPATDEQRETYELVLHSQLAGIETVGPDVDCVAVDKAARDVFEAADRNSFEHGLGHGVGLDIHEAPKLWRYSEETLRPGDVVTVEPGSYEVDWGGIRIEDVVVVTETGHEVLTGSPKAELLEL
jgi:Xaa-Pro aminopeptidase